MTAHDEYFALPAVNWSSLKALSVSPLHYHYGLTHPRADSPAMSKGRAVHTAVLEPLELPLRYVTFDGTRRGKVWDEFKAVNEDKEILTVSEWEDVVAIQKAVMAHPVAGELLTGGEAEVTIQWRDAATGIGCKARCDYIITGTAPWPILVDLKTARSIDERQFQRAYHDFKYHCQLAMYSDAVAAKYGKQPTAYIVAVESEAPHDVAVFLPTEDSLYAGHEEVDELLDLLKSCTASGNWPGRYPDVTDLDLPPWAYPSQAEVDDLITIRKKD